MNTIYFIIASVAILAGGVKWLTSKSKNEGRLEVENDQLRGAHELRGQMDKVDASCITDDQLGSLL